MFRALYFTILLLLIQASLSAQSLNRMLKNADHSSTVTLAKGDSVEIINLWNIEKQIKPLIKKHYYWYAQNKVKVTQGAYDGRLLHGDYALFNRNKDFIQRGKYKKGLKDGNWIIWHKNGNVAETVGWKNGKKHGKYKQYNSDGTINGYGKFRNNQLHGRVFKVTEDGKVESSQYSQGEIKSSKFAVRRAKKVLSKKDSSFQVNPVEEKQSRKKRNKKEQDSTQITSPGNPTIQNPPIPSTTTTSPAKQKKKKEKRNNNSSSLPNAEPTIPQP